MGDTGMMAAGYGMGGISALGNGISQGRAFRAEGRYGKSVADLNAQIADLQAKDAIDRGSQESVNLVRKTQAVQGAERASMAGQGVDVNSGSAAEIQADTAGLSALDQLTIKNNAQRAAWGFQAQGIQDTLQGQFARIAGRTNEDSSLIGGTMGFLKGGILAGYYASKTPPPPDYSTPGIS